MAELADAHDSKSCVLTGISVRPRAEPPLQILLSIVVGVFSGLSSSAFLYGLEAIPRLRGQLPWLQVCLPVFGFWIGWFYSRHGRGSDGGTALILTELRRPGKPLPARMAPLIFVSSLLTHLGGGSAGREGAAVQMAAGLSDLLTRWFRIDGERRRRLLLAGMAGGFGSALGTPWAGAVFGIESSWRVREEPMGARLLLVAGIDAAVASWVGCRMTHLLEAPHSVFRVSALPQLHEGWIWKFALAAAAVGCLSGLLGVALVRLTHGLQNLYARCQLGAPLRGVLGGVVVAGLMALPGMQAFSGLGVSSVQLALNEPARIWDPLLKLLATVLTLGSGFKGGEFVPLVFMGTTAASALSFFASAWLAGATGLLAVLGFASGFAGVSRTPITCTVMAMELFGPGYGPWALIACLVSARVARKDPLSPLIRAHS